MILIQRLLPLINHHIGHAPKVELAKRGNKPLVIPEGTTESQLGILINKFTRGGVKEVELSRYAYWESSEIGKPMCQ